MHSLGATRGRLIYVSMADLADTRTWPPDDGEFLERDAPRFQTVVARAHTVRDEIVENGVATAANEIPFQPCGCFLCESEDLMLDREIINDTDTKTNSKFEGNSVADGSVASTVATHDSTDQKLADVTTQPLVTDNYHIPSQLKARDIWVVWDTENKIARAPWETGTMYPVQWAESSDVNPRHEFEKAEMVADLPVERVNESWPFPSGGPLPEAVAPSILLEHADDLNDDPVTFVNFDDVRDPDSMATSQEALNLVDELGGYAELSQSKTGLHVFVRGGLPQGVTTFSAPLQDVGHVEIYDHSRFVATTFNHIEDTPLNDLPDAGEVLKEIVDRVG